MIKLQAIGHLGKDCIQNTVNNRSVLNFSIAHSEKYKDAQGVQQNKSIWIDCAYWSDKVAIAPYLKQGTLVFVEGSPEVRQYTTRDGKKGVTLSLRVSQIQLLGGKKEESGGSGTQNSNNQYSNQQSGGGFSNDDLNDPNNDPPF